MTTETLVEFLLTQIAEDEAEFGGDDFEVLRIRRETAVDLWDETQEREYRVRARVLAECGTKRRIVAACQRLTNQAQDFEYYGVTADDEILRALAIPYADHPDYREEWRSADVAPTALPGSGHGIQG